EIRMMSVEGNIAAKLSLVSSLFIRHSSFVACVERQRKSRADQRGRGSLAVLPRLLDVGNYFPGATGRARRAQAVATKDSVRNERTRGHARSQAFEVRQNRRRNDG